MSDPRFAPGQGTRGYVRHFATVEAVVAALEPNYPVYCLRRRELTRNAAQFLQSFPGEVLYAVKCNPHPLILQTFSQAGLRHFDAASLVEIAAVHAAAPAAEACYMHPVKPRGDIAEAYRFYGVRRFVVDHLDELTKMAEELGRAPDATVLVRLATPTAEARYALSRKFGAGPRDSAELLRAVHARGWRTGLAFHVGSQCCRLADFREAVELSAAVARDSGVPIAYLDVGGGFPAAYVGDTPPPLADFIETLTEAVGHASPLAGATLMCEPGRALVASGCSLLTQVHLRKDDALYINDGVYHSLSEALTGHLVYPARLVRLEGDHAAETIDFQMYGPTCDSTDVLPCRFVLPADTREGDWIEIGQVGAYSNAVSTHFNGIHPEVFVTVDSPPLLPA